MFEGFFKKNLNLKILSLVLAIFLWVFAHVTQHIPLQKQAEKSLELPLSVENLSPNLMVLEAPSEVFATVSSSDKKLEEAEPSSFKAYVDAQGKPGGSYQGLQVRIASPPGFTVVSVNPPTVSIVLDLAGHKQVPVTWEATGPHGRIQVQPAKVMVSGPKLQVEKVAAAQVEIPGSNFKANLPVGIQQLVPLPVDALGRPVPGLQVNPAMVEVMIFAQQVNKGQSSKE